MKSSMAIIAPIAIASVAVAGDFPISLSSNLTYSAITGPGGSVSQTGTWDPAEPYLFSYVSTMDQYEQQDYQFNIFVHGTSELDADSGQLLLGDAYDMNALDNAYNSSVTFNFTLASAARFASFYADPTIAVTLNGATITASTFTAGDTLAAGNYTLTYAFGSGGNYEFASFRFTEFPAGIPAPGALAVLGLAGLARGRRRK